MKHKTMYVDDETKVSNVCKDPKLSEQTSVSTPHHRLNKKNDQKKR